MGVLMVAPTLAPLKVLPVTKAPWALFYFPLRPGPPQLPKEGSPSSTSSLQRPLQASFFSFWAQRKPPPLLDDLHKDPTEPGLPLLHFPVDFCKWRILCFAGSSINFTSWRVSGLRAPNEQGKKVQTVPDHRAPVPMPSAISFPPLRGPVTPQHPKKQRHSPQRTSVSFKGTQELFLKMMLPPG